MNRDLCIRITFTLLRVIAGLVFAEFGSVIVFGWFGGSPGGQPPLLSQQGIGGILEVFGGSLIALGLFTRPAAFVVSGEMAVAYFQMHAPKGMVPSQNQGAPVVLFSLL